MTHTPDTDEVRACYGVGRFEMDADNGDHDAEFDRWFAAEESRIRADERQRIAEAIQAVDASSMLACIHTGQRPLDRIAEEAE